MRNLTLLAAASTAGALVLAGCSPSDSASDNSDVALSVAAGFYPLQFVAEEVGGDLVDVTALTAPGVDAHDLELSPAVVRSLQDMDLVIYLSEFQPAVDDAVATTGTSSIDARYLVDDHDDDHGDDEHSDDEHAEEGDGHDHGDGDPHFWLDPTLMADLAHTVAHEYAELDPDNAAAYEANADALAAELLGLDESFSTGLAMCERREIFVSHDAFGYMAERYDLEQHSVAGITPEAEPSPAHLLEIQDEINASGATTIFAENAVDASQVEAVAADTGVVVAVLNPVETLAEGEDYIGVMTSNLEALRTGLDCS